MSDHPLACNVKNPYFICIYLQYFVYVRVIPILRHIYHIFLLQSSNGTPRPLPNFNSTDDRNGKSFPLPHFTTRGVPAASAAAAVAHGIGSLMAFPSGAGGSGLSRLCVSER